MWVKSVAFNSAALLPLAAASFPSHCSGFPDS
jgi:hypothetical protein